MKEKARIEFTIIMDRDNETPLHDFDLKDRIRDMVAVVVSTYGSYELVRASARATTMVVDIAPSDVALREEIRYLRDTPWNKR